MDWNQKVGRIAGGVVLAVLAAGWLAPERALGMATETIGRARPIANQPGWAPGVRDALDLKSRVYSFWCNGNDVLYYRGDTKDLNAALRKFAAIQEKDIKVVFTTGTARATTFAKDEIPYDWSVQVPGGLYLYAAKAGKVKGAVLHPTMTVHLGGKRLAASDVRVPEGLEVKGAPFRFAAAYARVSEANIRTGFLGKKSGRLTVAPLFGAVMDAPRFQAEFFHTGPGPLLLSEALAAERVVLDGKEYAPRSVKFAGQERLAPHKTWRHNIDLANFLPSAARASVALETGEHTLVVRFAGLESPPARFIWVDGARPSE